MDVTVVLCPPLTPGAPDQQRREMAATLAGWGVAVVVPHRPDEDAADRLDGRLAMASWVADQAVAITSAAVDGPLILVSSGPANQALPALGFAQRASRRSVVAYVLIDGPLPDVGRAGADWPDAPAIYVSSDEQDPAIRAAQLRGWVTRREDPIAAVTRIARGWPDAQP